MDTEADVLIAGATDTNDNGAPAIGRVDGLGTNVKFVLIYDLRYSKYDNYIYIGDNSYSTDYTPALRRLNVYTQQVTTVVSDVTIAGHTGPGNQCPYNITFDYSGNVYYGSQHYGYGVKKFDIQTMTQSEYIGTSEFTPRNEDNYVFGIVFDNSWNGYLIHSHSMTKLTKVSGYDLSYNGYTNYFGNTSYSAGGNETGTGTTARVTYIQSVRNDPDVNSNALYLGTCLLYTSDAADDMQV